MPTDRPFSFYSDACPRDTFDVLSFQGYESISHLFRFYIELVSRDPRVNFDDVLEQPARLVIKQGIHGGDRTYQNLAIHGYVSDIELVETGAWVRYRVVLVPRLWRASLNFQSQIYLGKSIPEIIQAELEAAGLTADEFQVRCTGTHNAREYVVQYLEPDLYFLQRLAEHEGISYFFKYEERFAKVIFTDSNDAFVPIQGTSRLPFLLPGAPVPPSSPVDGLPAEFVTALSCRQRMVQSEVVLRDYNYRTPTTPLLATRPVVARAAHGRFYEYGNHEKNDTEGGALAEIRAQEIKCRRRVFTGRGHGKAFRAGSRFTLTQHPRGDDFNREYLLVEVRHQGQQPIEDTPTWGTTASYENEFVAIPADEPFRPERTTPKPRVAGVLNASVDAAGSGEYAEIDNEGRYKVKLPFDLSGRQDGTASRFIRMAQPYAGGGMGTHFPLHKGTEVILLHSNGDPDRPIIASAVPNPSTPSPVTGANQTQCRVVTPGTERTIENQSGSQKITEITHHGAGWTMVCTGAP